MAFGRRTLTRRVSLPRAALAVAALYALVLQAFLGGLMPLPEGRDGLCAQHVQADGPTDEAPAHHCGACCTAAQLAGGALPARSAAVPVAWPTARALRVADRAEVFRARAPPGRSPPPRGPPAA